MTPIRLFVASSSELVDYQRELVIHIVKKNKLIEQQNVQICIDEWEFESSSIPITLRSQDDYNKLLTKADIVVFLLKNKVGKYTQEEFELALSRLKEYGMPKICVYTFPPDHEDTSLNSFLVNMHGTKYGLDYFPVSVNNADKLWNEINNELDRIMIDLASLKKDQYSRQRYPKIIGRPDEFNSNLFDAIIKDVVIKIDTPVLPFNVDYFLLHVKNGQDEWLPPDARSPLNRIIHMHSDPLAPNRYSAVIKAVNNLGFQFKCFADCEINYIDTLIHALEKQLGYTHGEEITNKHGSFKLVEYVPKGNHIWFILPQYDNYAVIDKMWSYLNNYYHETMQ